MPIALDRWSPACGSGYPFVRDSAGDPGAAGIMVRHGATRRHALIEAVQHQALANGMAVRLAWHAPRGLRSHPYPCLVFPGAVASVAIDLIAEGPDLHCFPRYVAGQFDPRRVAGLVCNLGLIELACIGFLAILGCTLLGRQPDWLCLAWIVLVIGGLSGLATGANLVSNMLHHANPFYSLLQPPTGAAARRAAAHCESVDALFADVVAAFRLMADDAIVTII
ncbi:MAG: hypothetical protein U0841_29310 [Chloroflexia bacterium]